MVVTSCQPAVSLVEPLRVASEEKPLAASHSYLLVTRNSQLATLFLLFFAVGCTSPNKANITLRKQSASQQTQIQSLTRRNQVLTSQVIALQQSGNSITTLPLARLDLLFTAHGLEINRLSAGSDLYHDNHGQTGIRVYIAPLDDMGTPIQSTGSFVIDAYDLALPANSRIGHWTITPLQCKQAWTLGFMRAAYYMFELPYQQLPQHANITVHVQFTDELTGRTFTAERVVEVQPSNSRMPKS